MDSHRTSSFAALTLLLAATGAATGTALHAQARTPQQVLERYTKAIDPQGKLASLPGIRMVSEFEVPQAGKMKMTMAFQRPSSVLIEVESPVGAMKQGYDGTTGWSAGPDGARTLAGAELEQMKAGRGLETMGRAIDQFSKVEAAPAKQVDGKPTDCVTLTWKTGIASTECYARDNGLLVESSSAAPVPQGNTQTVTRFYDYEAEGGVLIARRMEVQTGPMAQTIRVTDVDVGPVDAKLFAPPAGLKKP